MANLRYIGNKAEKDDNVGWTGTVWKGAGDVQEVPDELLPKYLEHSGVWELMPDEEGAKPSKKKVGLMAPKSQEVMEAEPPVRIDVGLLDREALHAFAKRQFNHEFNARTPVPVMRAKLAKMLARDGETARNVRS